MSVSRRARNQPATIEGDHQVLRVLAWPATKNRQEQPYNYLLYSHIQDPAVRVEEFSTSRLLFPPTADIWHMHWPDHFLNDPYAPTVFVKMKVLLGLMDLSRAEGTKIIWTMHNLQSHEHPHPRLEAAFWRRFIPRLSGVVSPSLTGLTKAQDRYPRLSAIPGAVIPIGHFRGVYPDQMTKPEARERLGIASTSKVLVYLGHIRPYKNLPLLIRSFKRYSDPDAVLVVAGMTSSSDISQELEALAGEDSRVRTFLKLVPADEIQIFLRAADLVVLPFSDILNSSSALLALSFDRPLLVPSIGSLEELRIEVGEDWVRTYQGALDAQVVENAVNWALRPRQGSPDLDRHDWSEIAQRTSDHYKEVLRR